MHGVQNLYGKFLHFNSTLNPIFFYRLLLHDVLSFNAMKLIYVWHEFPNTFGAILHLSAQKHNIYDEIIILEAF